MGGWPVQVHLLDRATDAVCVRSVLAFASSAPSVRGDSARPSNGVGALVDRLLSIVCNAGIAVLPAGPLVCEASFAAD